MAEIDEIERLAAHLERELVDAHAYLGARLVEVLSPVDSAVIGAPALRAVGDTFELLRAGIWLWAESLRQAQGRPASDLVDSRLEVPEWDPAWDPAGDEV